MSRPAIPSGRRSAIAITLALTAAFPGLAMAAAPASRPVPESWSEAAAAQTVAAGEDRWWLAFADPALDRLIALVERSDDVALAEARLRQAAAQLGLAQSTLGPAVSITASADRQRIDALEQRQLKGALSLSWSPDLSGRRHLRVAAARARMDAQQLQLAAVRQATRATTARLYIAWRQHSVAAAAGDRLIDALQVQRDLAAARARAGLVAELDPIAAEATLADARTIPIAARERASAARLGLEALLGLPAGALALDAAAGVPAASDGTAAALRQPVSVLAGRPDLLALDRELAAAGFAAQASRRDFWPDLSLAGALGFGDVAQGGPLQASGLLTGLVGSLVAPVFASGQLSRARDGADAARDAAALRYRQASTQALAEVEQAIRASTAARDQVQTLDTACRAATDRAQLAGSRYRAGLIPFAEVLIAREAQARAEIALTNAQAEQSRAAVALQVAMGRGAQPAPAA